MLGIVRRCGVKVFVWAAMAGSLFAGAAWPQSMQFGSPLENLFREHLDSIELEADNSIEDALGHGMTINPLAVGEAILSIDAYENQIAGFLEKIELTKEILNEFPHQNEFGPPFGCRDAICLEEEIDFDLLGEALAQIVIDQCRDAICVDEIFELEGVITTAGNLQDFLDPGCQDAICLEDETTIVVVNWKLIKDFLGGCQDAICIDANAASSSSDDIKNSVKEWAEKHKENVNNSSAPQWAKDAANAALDEVIDLVDD